MFFFIIAPYKYSNLLMGIGKYAHFVNKRISKALKVVQGH